MEAKMTIILYSTDCPKCKILEQKLNELSIEYKKERDVAVMLDKGFVSAPMLEVDGNVMDFKRAVEWIKNNKELKMNT